MMIIPSPRQEIFTLHNGLRVAWRQTQGAVSYIGVAVNAGSRDEPSALEGLAHFVEHTLFKGTSRRRSWHISNRMESVGGELNAYTSKEETLLYTNAPAGYSERAIELLYDIVANSNFPQSELKKEREVIIEEIHSYLDSPADAVYDEFEELVYKGSPLAHNILGTEPSVRIIKGEDCRKFLDDFYTPANMVIYVCNPGEPEPVLRQLQRHFGRLHFAGDGPKRTLPPPAEHFNVVKDRNGHQAHTILGCRTFGRRDPRRFPLFLLNNHLGGPCMNSVLNQQLRDRRGLVYSVDSNVALLSDTGTLCIYFGADRDQTEKCISLIDNEIDRLAQGPLTERTFNRIRDQYLGQLAVSSDHRENNAMAMAKSLLYFNELHDISTTSQAIMGITREDFLNVAQILASQPLNRLTLQ